MVSAVASRWLAVGGAILIAAIAADSLVPVAWQVGTGLHWLTEHFLAYFAVTIVFCRLTADRFPIFPRPCQGLPRQQRCSQGF